MTRRHVLSRALPGWAIIRRLQFIRYILRAGAGAFVVTGQAVEFFRSTGGQADVGTFTLAGQVVRLVKTTKMAVAAAAFAVNGQTARLLKGFRAAAETGAFSLSGQAVAVRRTGRLVAVAGAFALTGVSAVLRKGINMAAGAAAFSLSGQGVSIRATRRIAAAAAAVSISGQAAVLKTARRVVAGSGAFSVSGQNVDLTTNLPFQVLATGRKTDETASTITISSIDFGAGGFIAFAFAVASSAGGNRTVSSISINGVAATFFTATGGASVAVDTLVAHASGVPSGVGTITVTFSSSSTFNGIYGVYRGNVTARQATDVTNATATSVSDSVNVAAGGFIVSAHFANATSDGAVFNSGVDEDFKGEVNNGTARTGMVGARAYPTAATPATVATTAGSSTLRRQAVASFTP